MLELVVPVLPHRLNDDWRKVIDQMDFLDIPGMRAVRAGVERGKRESADTLEEQMEIVKRGKVSYLFERYTDELQIQTLLLLSRFGLVSYAFLAPKRKYALLASSIIAAFHADLITMFVVMVPLYLMYEVSVWVALIFGKRKPAPVAEEEAAA